MTARNHSLQRMPRPTARTGWVAFYGLLGLSGGWLLWHQSTAIMATVHDIRLAQSPQLVGATLLFASSVLWASGVYHGLVPGRLRYGRTVVVQAAGLCANKLLPSGSGAIGLSYLYLRKAKVMTAQAAAVVTANNLLGFAGNSLLVGFLLIVQPSSRQFVQLHYHLPSALVTGIIVAVGAAVAGIAWRKPQIIRSMQTYVASVGGVLRRPNTLTALACSLGITLTYAATLWLVGDAVGPSLTFAQMTVVLTVGVAATSLVPTPGGIGAAEAGLYGGLRLYGVAADQALAIALLYRLVTFWLPLLYGAVALLWARRQKYL